MGGFGLPRRKLTNRPISRLIKAIFVWQCWGLAGIKTSVWNRDLRAAGVTEGRQAGAPNDDLAKQVGHANKRTTARVYDRDRLEAARRVAQRRVAYRNENGD